MTVWVVQNVHWVDRVDGRLKPKFSFNRAARFGEVKFLLDPTSSPFLLEKPLVKMHRKLKMFNDQDYLLLVGSPVLLGLAVAIAADYNDGNVNMLQWSGAKHDYIPCNAQNVFRYFNAEKRHNET